jgi:hypothetical protein
MYALTSSNISCSFDGVTYDLNLRCVCIENRVSFCQRLFLPTEPRRGSGTRRSRGRGCCLPRLAFRGRGGAQSSGIEAGMEGTPPTPPHPVAILRPEWGWLHRVGPPAEAVGWAPRGGVGGRKEGEVKHRSWLLQAFIAWNAHPIRFNAALDSILHNQSLHNTFMQPAKQQWAAFQKPR